jgi:hypothetical protein
MKNLAYLFTIGAWKTVSQHVTGNYKHSGGHMSSLGDSLELFICYGIVIIEVLIVALAVAIVH